MAVRRFAAQHGHMGEFKAPRCYTVAQNFFASLVECQSLTYKVSHSPRLAKKSWLAVRSFKLTLYGDYGLL